MICAVQDVNVIRDCWDWFFGWAGAVGGLAGAWAIWYAARTRREVALERRRIFELEVLREMVGALDEALANWTHAGQFGAKLRLFERRLMLLPRNNLPEWRKIVANQDWYVALEQEMGFTRRLAEIAERGRELDALRSTTTDTSPWAAESKALTAEQGRINVMMREGIDAVLTLELRDAVKKRVDANLPGPPRGLRGWLRRHLDKVRQFYARLRE